jgi:DNA-binding IclR family transcriptional regulator
MMGGMEEYRPTFVPTFVTTWRQAVIRRKSLRDSTVRVLVLLAERASPNGDDVWAGVDWIVGQLGYAPSSVKRCLAQGREQGWIKCVKRGRSSCGVSIYKLTFPTWNSNSPSPVP